MWPCWRILVVEKAREHAEMTLWRAKGTEAVRFEAVMKEERQTEV